MVALLAVFALVTARTPDLEFRRLQPLSWKEEPLVAAVADNRLLVGTLRGGLYELKAGSEKLTKIKEPGDTAAISVISRLSGRTFIGEYRSRTGQKVTPWVLPDGSDQAQPVEGLPDDAGIDSAARFDGGLIIGTEKYGIWRLPDGSLNAIHIAGPPDNDGVRSIFAQGDRVFMSLDFHGFWCLGAGRSQADQLTRAKSGRWAYGFACEQVDGQTLLGTSDGLWSIAVGSIWASPIPGIPGDSVVGCILANDHRALIGSSQGLYILESGKTIAHKVDRLPHRLDVIAMKLCKGTALIAASDGIWTLNPYGDLERLPTEAGLNIQICEVAGDQALIGGEKIRDNRIVTYWWILSDGRLMPVSDQALVSGYDHCKCLFFDGRWFVVDRLGLEAVCSVQ